MSADKERDSNLTGDMIFSHVIDAQNQVHDLNKRMEAIHGGFTKLSERQEQIERHVVARTRELVEKLFPKLGQEEQSTAPIQLKIPDFGVAILHPGIRLLAMLTGKTRDQITDKETMECFVKQSGPQPRKKKNEDSVDFYRLQIYLDYQGSKLGLSLTYDDDQDNEGASVGFSYSVNNSAMHKVLDRYKFYDPNDKWRELEDAAGFLSIIDRAEIVEPAQELGQVSA